MRWCGVVALFASFVVSVGCGGGGQSLNTPAGSGGSGGAGDQPNTTPFVFVSNSGSNTISGFAIDPSTGALTPVPGLPFLTPTPSGLARDGSGKYLTVANGLVTSGLPAISVIGVDPQTGALFDLHCIDREAPGNHPCYPLITGTRGTPQFVAAHQETLYVGNVLSNDVSVYIQDPPNGDLGTSIPSEFAAGVGGLRFLDFGGGKLWAAGDSGIAELNASPGAISLTVNLVFDNSVGYRAAAIRNSDLLFAIDQNEAIHVFSLEDSGENGFPVASPGGASSIAVLDNFVYVTHANSANVSFYSIEPGTGGALTFVTSLPAGNGATSARIFLGKFLYVANSGDGTVSGYGIDSKTGLLTPVPGSPFKTGTNPTFIAAH